MHEKVLKYAWKNVKYVKKIIKYVKNVLIIQKKFFWHLTIFKNT